jgi:hypothetical protein
VRFQGTHTAVEADKRHYLCLYVYVTRVSLHRVDGKKFFQREEEMKCLIRSPCAISLSFRFFFSEEENKEITE